MESTGLGGDPRVFADIAGEAEDAGWDGIYLSDPGYTTHGPPPAREICDTWVALATMAVSTERIRIGTILTPLPRYHPYEIAVRTASLDHLSNGRLEITAGVGHAPAFRHLGLDTADRPRRLRESLDAIARLWRGEGVAFGVEDATLVSAPVQRPRVPIRICAWNRGSSVDLAAEWDGLHLPHFHPDVTCDERGCFERVGRFRSRLGDRALVIEGLDGRPRTDPALCRSFESIGVTMWLEPVYTYQMNEPDPEGLRVRISEGPPR